MKHQETSLQKHITGFYCRCCCWSSPWLPAFVVSLREDRGSQKPRGETGLKGTSQWCLFSEDQNWKQNWRFGKAEAFLTA